MVRVRCLFFDILSGADVGDVGDGCVPVIVFVIDCDRYVRFC